MSTPDLLSARQANADPPRAPLPPRTKEWRRAARVAKVRSNTVLALMAAPGLLVVLVFSYVPMMGIVIAFQDYRARRGIFRSDWVGFENFQFLFTTNDAWRITFNTVFMNSLFIVANLVGALTLALLLNEVRDRAPFITKFYQSAMFLPFVFSYVVVTYFVVAFLDRDSGLMNRVLESFGADAVDWYSTPGWWPLILTIVETWKSVGFWVIVYLAGIMAINPEYYEAASMDGASRWQQIRLITLPMLAPLVVINVLLSFSRIFHADFGLFFQVTKNSPLLYPTTDVIDTYVYRSLTSLGDFGMAGAAGLYQAVVGFVLVVTANWIVRRRDGDKALF